MLMVNQLTGFGGGDVAAAAGPVTFVIDDGDDTQTTSNSTTQAFGANTATGPDVFVGLTWHSDGVAQPTLSSLAWNGVNGSILRQATGGGSGARYGSAIVYFSGSQSGNLTATFDETTDRAAVSKLSFSGVSSSTSVGTDASTGTGGTTVADAGTDGLLIGCAILNGTSAITWSGDVASQEPADFTVDSFYRHGMSYNLAGGTSGDIAGTGDQSHVLVSIR
jgi:hypothetical protein